MAKSQAGRATDHIASEFYRKLKPLGFKKRSRTFNRTVSEGWYHVIEFELIWAPRMPAHQQFFLSVGVAQDMVTETLKKGFRTQRFADFASLWDCFIAYTLHRKEGLVKYDQDAGLRRSRFDPDIFWNPLDDEATLTSVAYDCLQTHGLPLLDALDTKEKIFACYSYLNPQTDKYKAVLLHELGMSEESEKLLAQLSQEEKRQIEELRSRFPNGLFFARRPAQEIVQKLKESRDEKM
jgi:hypothetical protein